MPAKMQVLALPQGISIRTVKIVASCILTHQRGVGAQAGRRRHAEDVCAGAAAGIVLGRLAQPHHRPPHCLPNVLHHHVA